MLTKLNFTYAFWKIMLQLGEREDCYLAVWTTMNNDKFEHNQSIELQLLLHCADQWRVKLHIII